MLPTPTGVHQRQIRQVLEPLVERAGQTPGADRYRKIFPAVAHLWVLLLHHLLGAASLRQTHAILGVHPGWWRRWGMPRWLSYSQLARSSTSRPPACVDALLAAVAALARQAPPGAGGWRQRGRLLALDHTFLALSARLSPWSQAGGHAAGVRVQTLLGLADTIPHQLALTDTTINDRTFLATGDLTPWRGWTVLCDLGYYGHRQLARLRASGVAFITRLHPQAAYVIGRQRRPPWGPTPDGDAILLDATITLGSPNNRRGTVLPGLRLVVSRNAQGVVHRFVTDRHDLAATEVVRLYRQRWQIELYFRWLKHQLGLVRPLGHSRAAVWLTVLLVVIVALVMLLLERQRPPGVSRVAVLHAVGTGLLLAFALGSSPSATAPG